MASTLHDAVEEQEAIQVIEDIRIKVTQLQEMEKDLRLELKSEREQRWCLLEELEDRDRKLGIYRRRCNELLEYLKVEKTKSKDLMHQIRLEQIRNEELTSQLELKKKIDNNLSESQVKIKLEPCDTEDLLPNHVAGENTHVFGAENDMEDQKISVIDTAAEDEFSSEYIDIDNSTIASENTVNQNQDEHVYHVDSKMTEEKSLIVERLGDISPIVFASPSSDKTFKNTESVASVGKDLAVTKHVSFSSTEKTSEDFEKVDTSDDNPLNDGIYSSSVKDTSGTFENTYYASPSKRFCHQSLTSESRTRDYKNVFEASENKHNDLTKKGMRFTIAQKLCEVCDEDFEWHVDSSLYGDLNDFSNEPFKCAVCCKKFMTRTSFMKHIDDHKTLEKPHKCEMCGQSFTNHELEVVHRSFHHGIYPYICEICETIYRHARTFLRHKERHNMPFKCRFCHEKFPTRLLFVLHRQIHFED